MTSFLWASNNGFAQGIPDIFRDLRPRDKLPEDPEDTRLLSDGEKFWITQAAPLLHRQLLQILSIGAFLAQETSGAMGKVDDGTRVLLDKEELANLCSSMVALTMDSIRTVVDLQRSRLLRAARRTSSLGGGFSARDYFREASGYNGKAN